jgi:hypothetical protein
MSAGNTWPEQDWRSDLNESWKRWEDANALGSANVPNEMEQRLRRVFEELDSTRAQLDSARNQVVAHNLFAECKAWRTLRDAMGDTPRATMFQLTEAADALRAQNEGVVRDSILEECRAWREADDVDTGASCSEFPWKDKARQLRGIR